MVRKPMKIHLLVAFLICILSSQSFAENLHAVKITGGTTAGTFSVDGNGGANYSIPIEVPPGTNDVAPNLSLIYQSQKPNGVVGMGFTLSGVSSITRCPRTVAQDRAKGGVALNDDDRFCMDGARLMAIEGNYGDDGTVYHTEWESWSKIVSYGQCGSGPCYFTITTKKGVKQSYGANTDSRIEAQGKSSVLVWALDKTTDLNGNFLQFEYDEDQANGNYRINEIIYTGNSHTNLSPQRSVTFTYEDRADAAAKYIAGSMVRETKRLKAIQSFVGLSVVKSYRLSYTYSPQTQRSLIQSVQECDDEGICLAPTVFAWVEGDLIGTFNITNATLAANWINEKDSQLMAGDYNGDGRTDILLKNPRYPSTPVYFSKGDGTFNITNATLAANWINEKDSQLMAGDYNGDGRTDILLKNPRYSTTPVYFSTSIEGAAWDLMKTVTNGVGGTTEVIYKPLTDPSVYTKGSGATYPIVDVQSAFYVVSQHTNSDGRRDNEDGSHSYTFRHTYAKAQTDWNGRGWLGFETVNLIDSGSGVTTTTIHNMTFPLTGGIQGTKVRDTATDNLLQTTANTYAQSRPYTGVYQVTRSSETTSWYNNATPDYTLEKNYAYDAYGNLATVTDLGDAEASDTVIYTCTQYSNDATDNSWRLGFPTNVKIGTNEAHCQDFTSWHAESDASWTQFAYDPKSNLKAESEYLYDSASSTGSWITTAYAPDAYGNTISVTDPLGNTTVTVYDATYHTFPTKITLPPPQGLEWQQTACATEGGTCSFSGTRLVKYGADQSRYYRLATNSISCSNTVFGDPALGVGKSCFASTTDPTQSPALTETAVFEPKFGAQTSATDPNGNVTTSTIDGFGRTTHEYGPNPNGDSVLLQRYEYANGGGTNPGWMHVTTRERTTWDNDTQADWYNEYEHIDGMGRTFQVVSTSTSRTNDDLILSETFFDNAGRVWKEAVPRYRSDTPSYVTRTYINHNLPGTVTQPDSAQATLTYDFRSLGVPHADKEVTWTTPSPENSATGSETVNNQEFLNSRGQVVRKVAADGGVTNYTHDILGNVLTKTDPLAMVTTYTYDSLGRLLTVSMPSRGATAYTYDANGNTLTVTDAKGQVVTFTYDALDRPESKNISSDGSVVTVSAYTYDDPDQLNNKGRLSSVAKYDGDTVVSSKEVVSSTFAYDAYGNITTKTTAFGTLLNPPSDAPYAENSTYHPSGDMDTYTYPDGSILTQTYTPEGFLSTVSLQAMVDGNLQPIKTYATYTNYNALGQAENVAYGNGVNSTYTFDEIGRRLTSQTVKGPVGSPTTQFLDYSYSWNQANKLLGIEDNIHAVSSQTFSYDKKGRLKTAQGAYPEITYGYDFNGNIQTKNDVSYSYDTTKANQLVTIGDNPAPNVTYDANGNMLTRPASADGSGTVSRRYVYDPEDNLIDAYGDGSRTADSVAEYSVYDDAGERIRKLVRSLPSTDQSVTWYVSPEYEVTAANEKTLHTKYIHGPDGLIASITNEIPPQQTKAATHTMKAGMYGSDSISALSQKIYHHLQAFMADPDPNLGGAATRVGVVLLALLLLPLLFVWFGRRGLPPKAQGMPGGIWRRLMRKITTGVVITAFLFTNVIGTAYADLTPGPNGAGIPAAGTNYFHQNDTFSTTLVTDDTGIEVTRIAYAPYGSIDEALSSGEDQSRSKYGGKELDRAADIYYFGDRFYDPDLGRFLSPDPDWQFNSPYASDDDDPKDYFDPNGQFAFLIAAIVIGAVIGAYSGGAAVNHDANPASWNWSSGETWAGMIGGAVLGGVGGAAGSAIAGAGFGAAGTLAAMGVLGGVENFAFTAMGGGGPEELGISFAQGFAFGVLFAGAGAAIGRAARTAAGQALKRSVGAGLRRVARAFGRGCSSFPEGTPVLTQDGSKPIEDIAFGDEVWSYNAETGQPEIRPVNGLVTRIAAGIVVLSLGATTIEATAAHPFYVPDEQKWVPAAELQIGDETLRRDGSFATVTATQSRAGEVRVFNFEVDGNHSYFAGDASLLVHNSLCANNARKLRANMMKLKKYSKGRRSLPAKYNDRAHHIVESTDPKMVKARARLSKHSIDINDADNGIFLARGSAEQTMLSADITAGSKLSKTLKHYKNAIAHSRIHTQAYKDHVTKRIMAADSAVKIRKALGQIRRQIYQGKITY